MSLLLTTVASKPFNAFVITNPLYYLYFTSSEPLGKLMYCKIKVSHWKNPNGKHTVGQKTIENLQTLPFISWHKARQGFSLYTQWQFSCYSSLPANLKEEGAGSRCWLCLSSLCDLSRQQGINTMCGALQAQTTLCGTKLGRGKAEGHSNTPSGIQELHSSGAQLPCPGCWALKLLQLGIGKLKDGGKEIIAFGNQWT